MFSKLAKRSLVSQMARSALRLAPRMRTLATATVTPPEGLAISLKSATRDDSKFGTRPIYLDVQATTQTDPRVLDKMLQFYTGLYGNPHSSTHSYGWETEKEVELARVHIADVIKADPKEIILTSGATESNNMAIKGVPRFYKKTKKHIITTQTEHKCVLDSARHMQDEGFDVTYLPGIGACYVRRRPRVRLDPIITGGGQERGLRSGTLAPPLVAGFGEAARLMKVEHNYDQAHIQETFREVEEWVVVDS
ncbi:hypothetical protein HF325_003609 [Metschnikowia pulcherrima]|uniref:Aminotransferase class V domain-containing protein n=1 Tax=Metschnikowia pulcherrima TaxID=27326 RepID=A0A8H7GU91_9ASCO|nr:hypothetical protein HF325_003609 [Metschnikowia pulcherrima]